MQLVVITDLHGRLGALERILAEAGRADAVLLGGDLTSFGSPADAERVVALARQAAPEVLAVAGNCDSAAIERRLEELGVALHGRGVLRGRVGIQGLSAIPPWRRGMYQVTEEELAAALGEGHRAIDGAEKRVLLAHVPPHGLKVDRTFFWTHAGSTALRTFIDRTQPELVLCGHIHEGRGVEIVGRSTVVNCGLGARGEYAVSEVGDTGVQVELRQARG